MRRLLKYPLRSLARLSKGQKYLNPTISFNSRTITHKTSVIGNFSNISSAIIGRYTYISQRCRIPYTRIGSFSSIGDRVEACFGIHPTSSNISTSPIFFAETNPLRENFCYDPNFESHKYISDNIVCDIGSDVWVGSHVKILDGITIHHGAVIGLGSVVTRDIPPYAICAGVPARVKRYRFSREVIDLLLAIKWWNKDLQWITENACLFKNPNLFIETLNTFL